MAHRIPRWARTCLNRADSGLLESLEKIPASAASATSHGGGSIAAHADHLRYGLSLLNRRASEEETPWTDADWTANWRTSVATEDEWRTLRVALRREADDGRDDHEGSA